MHPPLRLVLTLGNLKKKKKKAIIVPLQPAAHPHAFPCSPCSSPSVRRARAWPHATAGLPELRGHKAVCGSPELLPFAAILPRGHGNASPCKGAPTPAPRDRGGCCPPRAAPRPGDLPCCGLAAGQGLRDMAAPLGAFITTDAKMTIKES